MKFYQRKDFTLQELVEQVLSGGFFTLEQCVKYKNSLITYLKDYWSCGEVMVTYTSVTNSGGVPHILPSDSLSEGFETILQEQNDGYYTTMSDDEKAHELELLAHYTSKLSDNLDRYVWNNGDIITKD